MSMQFLISVVAFLVAIAILVTVHEFGHYWVARRLGVRVLTFSVGFGRPLWTWVRERNGDRIEYVIAALPLGGYVRMLDEREGPVPEPERGRAFNLQPVWKRAAIVAAGPAINLVFALLAWWLMFMVGINGMTPLIGTVSPETPAWEAGLRSEDRLLEVNGKPVPTWEAARLALLDASLDGEGATLRYERGALAESAWLPMRELRALAEGSPDILELLGLRPWQPALPVKVRELTPGGAAERAGLRTGDTVLDVNGQAMRDTRQFIETLRDSPGKRLTLGIERDGAYLELALIPESRERAGRQEGFIGAMLGADLPPEVRARMVTEVRLGPVDALIAAGERLSDMTALTLRVLVRLVTGEASVSNISGPIGIADYAGKSAVLGLAFFLSFLALVSLSLAIFNLLPVPVLDGGHLLLYLIEAVRGRPLGAEAEALFQRVGLSLLVGLMLIAFYNDITRYLG